MLELRLLRRFGFAFGPAVALVAVAVMLPVADARAQSGHAAGDTASHDARLALEQRMPIVDFEHVPARDAIQRAADSAGANLVVRWDSLDAEGIDSVWTVSLTGRDMPVGRVIDLVLKQIADPSQIVVTADRFALTIMTRKQALADRETRIYLVQDLADRLEQRVTAQPQPDQTQRDRESLTTLDDAIVGDGVVGGVSVGATIDLLTQTVEPDIWLINGGTAGRIQYYAGRVHVHAPRFVHNLLSRPPSPSDVELRDASMAGAQVGINEWQTVAVIGREADEPVRPRRFRPSPLSPSRPELPSLGARDDWSRALHADRRAGTTPAARTVTRIGPNRYVKTIAGVDQSQAGQ